ncbi:MAG TPA: imidazolonepropionase, partial [Puia sp.]
MSSQLIINARLAGVHSPQGPLRGAALSGLPCIDDGWLLVEDEQIAELGDMKDLPKTLTKHSAIDAAGRWLLPAWCDSHTHLVYAGSREMEFVDKIRGLSYAEINARGGGILNSARVLRETSEDALFDQAWKRVQELGRLGTASIEIKSGYGLTVDGELKMLRVIKKLKQRCRHSIKASFLGAHTYPPEYRDDHPGYIDLIINARLAGVHSPQGPLRGAALS